MWSNSINFNTTGGPFSLFEDAPLSKTFHNWGTKHFQTKFGLHFVLNHTAGLSDYLFSTIPPMQPLVAHLLSTSFHAFTVVSSDCAHSVKPRVFCICFYFILLSSFYYWCFNICWCIDLDFKKYHIVVYQLSRFISVVAKSKKQNVPDSVILGSLAIYNIWKTQPHFCSTWRI